MENNLENIIFDLDASVRNIESKLNQALSFSFSLPGGTNSDTVGDHKLRAFDQATERLSNNYHSTLSGLKTRRNGLLDVNRLPPEILGAILHLTSTPSASGPNPYWRLAWVCRHWRDVILDNADFWSIIYITSRMTVDRCHTIAERSKGRKLDVRLTPVFGRGSSGNNTDTYLGAMLASSDLPRRIAKLSVFGLSWEVFSNILRRQFPSLRKLVFDTDIPYQQSSEFSLLLQGCPSLEILVSPFSSFIKMDHRDVYLLKPIWQNIQRLDLDFSVYDFIDLVQLIAILKYCTKLKNLAVHAPLCSMDEIIISPLSITLPSLSILFTNIYPLLQNIHAPRLDLFGIEYQRLVEYTGDNVLNDFDFSKITNLHLAQESEEIWVSGSRQSSNLKEDLQNRWWGVAPGRCCELIRDYRNRRRDVLPRETALNEDTFPNPYLKNSFYVAMPWTELSFDRIRPFVAIMPNIKEFTFYYPPPSYSPQRTFPSSDSPKRTLMVLAAILRSLPSVSTLKVVTQDQAEPWFPWFLKHLKSGLICPLLETLVLGGMHDLPYVSSSGELGGVLLSVLQSRKRAKVKLIKTVTLVGCTEVHISWIEELAGMGTEIIQVSPHCGCYLYNVGGMRHLLYPFVFRS